MCLEFLFLSKKGWILSGSVDFFCVQSFESDYCYVLLVKDQRDVTLQYECCNTESFTLDSLQAKLIGPYHVVELITCDYLNN